MRRASSCAGLLVACLFAIAPANATPVGQQWIIATHPRTSQVFRVDPVSGVAVPIASGDLLDEPLGVAIAADGGILVADRRAHRVVRIDPATGVQTLVSDDADLTNPISIAIGGGGTIYVGNESPGSIVAIDPLTGQATPLVPEGTVGIVDGLAFHDNHLIVATGSLSQLLSVSLAGEIEPISYDDLFGFVRNPIVRADGQLFVTNEGGVGQSAVLHVDPADGEQNVVASGGYLSGHNLQGIVLEPSGTLIVADNGLGAPGDGGLIRVDPATGLQSILVDRNSSELHFTNGWGIAVTSGVVVPEPASSVLLVFGVLVLASERVVRH
jgi:DNA-binding beta-propeller fold protein YncE